MGSTVGSRIKLGVVEGTGAEIKIALLWTPRRVELCNVDGNCSLVWHSTMAKGGGQKTVTSGGGTTDISYITSGGITPVEQLQLQDGDRGFTLGTDSDLNQSGENVHWIAFE